MQEATAARYFQVIALAQARNAKHLRFAVLMTILIALLLWRTQWLSLHPGLIVLLIGQLGAALILFYRNAMLSRNLHQLRSTPVAKVAVLAWFSGEEVFVKRLALFEDGLRLLGFVLLAYGFWVSTGSLLIALVIGIAYPVTVYFGIGRKRTVRTLRDLEAQKDRIGAI